MSNRLMIVDDALIMRMRIKEIALESGWVVVAEAINGVDAVEKFQSEKPNLVTLDIVMPIQDGVETLRQLRIIDSRAKVCMVSAVNQKEKLAECIRLGAIDFVVKPFDQERLRDLFQKQLRAAELNS